ncbi:MAG TPA: MBL fold metallo-hydrolase [Edaphocola sp.]|nr:MBL fold metallo-hydrolase [Edaphocola sp.]
MLQIKSFTFNPFQENTYIIYNENKRCWIIDPGMYSANEERELNNFIAQNNLQPIQIINTHGHIDHIFGVDGLKQKYNIPFGLHKDDEVIVQNAIYSATMFGLNFTMSPQVDFHIESGNLKLDDEILEVSHVPGHSPGSIAFYYPADNWVIGGDVLFEGSIGRTDLPGGNFDTLIKSIKTNLFVLPEETIVYSGHGIPTTIAKEKKYNPFIQ